MRRREFIAALGVALWPMVVRGQQAGGVRRVGVLMGSVATDTESQSYLAAFIQGLRQLGWNEGQNIRLDVRWSAGDTGLAHAVAGIVERGRLKGFQMLRLDVDHDVNDEHAGSFGQRCA